MCFVWISEQTAIISLYNINWLVFVTETESVYCTSRTGCLYTIDAMYANNSSGSVHLGTLNIAIARIKKETGLLVAEIDSTMNSYKHTITLFPRRLAYVITTSILCYLNFLTKIGPYFGPG
jgi:hypothetical protein